MSPDLWSGEAKTTLTDGSPVTPDHREIITEGPRRGQQKAYVILSEDERAKGFVRPVRRTYIHVGIDPEMDGPIVIRPAKGGCGTRTTMALSIAETFARDPKFYSGGGFCCSCGVHVPSAELIWDGTTEIVGS